MALLHRAVLRPTKLDLLAAWLPNRGWYHGPDRADVARVASYRFDDPAGAVGIETLLVSAGDGTVYQVPLTYRDAPLGGADDWLIGTADHSVLGRRWVYDACGDLVYAAALAHAILTGSGQAEEYFEIDGRRETRAPSMTITSSGTRDVACPPVGALHRVVDADPTVVVTDSVELTIVRRLGGGGDGGAGDGSARIGDAPADGVATRATLTGSWDGQPAPLPLAYAVPR